MIDITGKTFGRLTVVKNAGQAKNKEYLWLCKCQCGLSTIAKGYYLRSGITKSCGCLQQESRTKHGHALSSKASPTYKSWENMMQRCTNPKHHHWSKYGGAGITVCDRWKTFTNFLQDMGERPEGKTIDRIDFNKGYEPQNCKWSTPKEQQRNRKACRMITWKGTTKSMVEWSEFLKIPYSILEGRIRRNLPLERAFTQRPLIGGPVFRA